MIKPSTHIPLMPILLLLFILFSIATTGFGLVLRARQAAYVARHRDAVPPAFAATVTLADHQRAADYERARLRLGGGRLPVRLGSRARLGRASATTRSMAAVAEPHLARPDPQRAVPGRRSARCPGCSACPSPSLRTFGVEQRFGFNRTRPAASSLDKLKGAVLSLGLSVPLLYGLLWLMRQPGPWWLWAWLGLVALMLVMIDVYPRWIAPLFNRFTPLEGTLRTRIEGLLQRCGFQAAGLFVMDASRRSAHGNAYFTGLGRSKRIVLFDTLIASNSEAELEAVLAHELGHFKLNHILHRPAADRRAAVRWPASPIGVLCKQPWLLPSFGIAHQDDAWR